MGVYYRVASPPLGKRDGATRATIPSRTAAVTGSANTTYNLDLRLVVRPDPSPDDSRVGLLPSRPRRLTEARSRCDEVWS